MTPLRQRMIEDMQVRNLSANTQASYLQQVSLFACHFNRSPHLLGPEDIRTYQLYLTNEKKAATGSIHIAIAALRFLYKVTRDHQRNSYNSCRDRHCPKCQSLARAEWLEKRESELLNVPYFHVVFTLPDQVAAIAYQNKEQVYDIFFRTTSETLQTIAADPKHLGADIGFFSVLHTWGSALTQNPHSICAALSSP